MIELSDGHEPLLPLRYYHQGAVREFMAAVVEDRRGTRTRRRPIQDPAYVDRAVALNVPDLPSLNRYLEHLKPLQLRAIIGLFGLDDGVRKTLQQVGDRFGCTGSAIAPHVEHSMARLRHPVRTQRP